MNNKLNEEMFECKMYITDLETDRKSKEIDVQDLVFNDYIEFEFGDYEDEDYLQLPYNDFKFFINDYSVTFYSPQYHKLQSNWNSLREWIKQDLKQVYRDCGHRNSIMREVLDKMNELESSDSNDSKRDV